MDEVAWHPFQGVKAAPVPQKQGKGGGRAPKRSVSHGPVVGGYDEHADFGDILAAFDAGEDVSRVKKGDDVKSRIEDQRPFSEIFAEWEESKGIAPPKPKQKTVPIKKSQPYKQTKDFGSILDRYEGKVVTQTKVPSVHASDLLRRTEAQEQDEKQKPKAKKPQPKVSFVDPYSKKARTINQTSEPAPAKPSQASVPSVQKPRKDFGDLLAEFDGTPNKKKPVEEAKPQPKAKKKKQKFVDPYQKLKNGAKTEAPEEEVPKVEEKAAPVPSQVIKSDAKDFGQILDRYEGKTVPEPVVEAKPVEEPVPVVRQPSEQELEEQRRHEEELKREALKQKLTDDGVKWAGSGLKVMVTDVAHQAQQIPEGEEPKGASRVIPSGKSFGETLDAYHAKDKPKPVFPDLSSLYADTQGDVGPFDGRESARQKSYSVSELKKMAPQATHDLHGVTGEEARKLALSFLEDSWKHHLVKVSIITGKGLHSQNSVPVVKEMVESVLKGSALVRGYTTAPRNKGGSGALWVLLKEHPL